jgi:hypothetical protein
MRPCFICTDAPVAQKVRQIQTKHAIQQVKEGQVSNGSQASTADVPARTESARATTVSGDRKRPWMLTPCQIRSSRSIGIPTVCNQPTWVVNAGAALTVADGDGTRRFAGRAMESSSLRFAQHTAIFESSRRLPLNPPSCAQGAPAPTSSAGRMSAPDTYDHQSPLKRRVHLTGSVIMKSGS